MNNKIPDEDKRIKISISIDPYLNSLTDKVIVDKKFYKKSRFIEYLIKKYLSENDYKFEK